VSGLAVSLFWALLFVGGGIYLAYQRIDLRTSTIATGIALAIYTVFGSAAWWWLILLWIAFGLMVVPNIVEVRREKITKPLLAIYRKMLPSLPGTQAFRGRAGFR
jgi:acyl-CoA dehydrogenase